MSDVNNALQQAVFSETMTDRVRTYAEEAAEKLKAPDFLEHVLKEADKLTRQNPETGWKTEKDAVYQVKKLGYFSDRDKAESMRLQAASLLLAMKRAFTIQLETKAQEETLFAISDIEPEEIESLLAGSFGICKVEERAVKNRPMAYTEYLRLGTALTDPQEMKENREKMVPEVMNFLESASRMLIGYPARIFFHFEPADREWTKKQYEKTCDCLNRLAAVENQKIQYSGTVNGELDAHDNMIEEKVKGMRKREVFLATLSNTVGRDVETTFSQVSQKIKEVRQYMERLERAGRDGWFLTIGISSDSQDGAARAKDAAAAFGERMGYRADWSKTPKVSLAEGSVNLYDYIRFPARGFVGVDLEEYHTYAVSMPEPAKEHLRLGNVLWGNYELKQDFTIDLEKMNRHAAVFGKTGFGKSTTVFQLIRELGGKEIPCLVIEPTKGEYRNALPESKVYTMEAGSPEQLAVNPFWFPRGTSLSYHKTILKNMIASAFELEAAMPQVLEQSISSIYDNYGWTEEGENIYEGLYPAKFLYPTFSALVREVESNINRNFQGRLKDDYKSATLARLQAFTSGTKSLLLNEPVDMDYEAWLLKGSKVVIELDALGDDSEKALVMGIILAQFMEAVKKKVKNSPDMEELQHVFVLEEAHRLFASEEAESHTNSTARRELTKMLENMLREARAYGEGFIVVDQSPSQLSRTVLSQTAVKIVHNMDDIEDIKLLNGALLQDEEDLTLAKLEKGEAMVRIQPMDTSAKIHVLYREQKLKNKMFRPQMARNQKSLAIPMAERILIQTAAMRELSSIAVRFINQYFYLTDNCRQLRGLLGDLRIKLRRIVNRYGDSFMVSGRADIERELYYILIERALEETLMKIYRKSWLVICIKEWAMRTISLGEGVRECEFAVLADYRDNRLFGYCHQEWEAEFSEEMNQMCLGHWEYTKLFGEYYGFLLYRLKQAMPEKKEEQLKKELGEIRREEGELLTDQFLDEYFLCRKLWEHEELKEELVEWMERNAEMLRVFSVREKAR